MAAAGGRIEAEPDSEGPGRFRVLRAESEGRPAELAVDRRTIEDWLQRGWLEKGPSDTLRLNAAGHSAAGTDRPADTDGISRFRRQHGLVGDEVRTIDGRDQRVTADAAESPLAWLVRRRDRHGRSLIDETQYAAGERLRADFTVAGLSPRVTASWEQSISSGSSGRSGPGDAMTVSERALDARRRVDRAMIAAGPELAGILLEVCCLANGLEAAERRLGLPPRAGKVVLQIGLARLVDHYGMGSPATADTNTVRIRSWGANDYRPALYGPTQE